MGSRNPSFEEKKTVKKQVKKKVPGRKAPRSAAPTKAVRKVTYEYPEFGDTVKAGDEWRNPVTGEWQETTCVGWLVGQFDEYRREVPAPKSTPKPKVRK